MIMGATNAGNGKRGIKSGMMSRNPTTIRKTVRSIECWLTFPTNQDASVEQCANATKLANADMSLPPGQTPGGSEVVSELLIASESGREMALDINIGVV